MIIRSTTYPFIFLALLFGLPHSGYSLKKNCQDLKTGKFKIVNKELEITSFITRTADTQIEDVPSIGWKIKFKVIWIDSCTYQLKYLETLKNERNLEYPVEGIVTAQIVSIKGNSHFIKTTDNLTSQEALMEVLER